MIKHLTAQELQKLKSKIDRKTRIVGDCHLWNQAARRGVITVKGKTYLVRRVAWFLENGNLPPNAIIVTTCGDGNCINPDHLIQTTLAALKQEKSKLTSEQVENIRREYKGRGNKPTQEELARKYGVSQRYISYIVRNERYI